MVPNINKYGDPGYKWMTILEIRGAINRITSALSTVHRINDGKVDPHTNKYVLPDDRENYLKAVRNPRNKWVKWMGASVMNYLEGADHMFSLMEEYYRKCRKRHKLYVNKTAYYLQSPPYSVRDFENTPRP